MTDIRQKAREWVDRHDESNRFMRHKDLAAHAYEAGARAMLGPLSDDEALVMGHAILNAEMADGDRSPSAVARAAYFALCKLRGIG